MTGLERLRKEANRFIVHFDIEYHELRSIADQIERETLPRPLFEDGTPVQFGDEFVAWNGTVGTVSAINVVDNARLIVINSSSSNNYIVGAKDSHGRFAKRPEPPDSWERLTAEVEDSAGSSCRYFKKEYNPENPTCFGCKAHEADGDCTMLVMLDVLHRAKKLAGVE